MTCSNIYIYNAIKMKKSLYLWVYTWMFILVKVVFSVFPLGFRLELQQKLEQIILLDVEVASKHNVEQVLWKSVYYQVIEMFRRQLSEDKEDDSLKTRLSKILDEVVI